MAGVIRTTCAPSKVNNGRLDGLPLTRTSPMGHANYRTSIGGIAAMLVADMEADNGHAFCVRTEIASELQMLCDRKPMQDLTLTQLATLSSGEHSDQQHLIANVLRVPGENGKDVGRVYELLSAIFETPEDGERRDDGGEGLNRRMKSQPRMEERRVNERRVIK